MAWYTITAQRPHRHFIDIEARFETGGKESIQLQLPSWRPGRYELANYAQNIQQWAVTDETGKPLKSSKIAKDCWHVECSGAGLVIARYNYYANQLDAGASFFDETQLYVNPINCLIYKVGALNSPCHLRLEGLPEKYQIASGLDFSELRETSVDTYHTLADSPFIASNALLHETYESGKYKFHLWIQGECHPEWAQIKHDFTRFSDVQIAMFGELPVLEYHFLYQLPAFKFYHGVEHLNSTVIALGPGYRLMEPDMYADFVGISSHELFHSWNIKSIRPIEMMPYDYTKENYTSLGYVAEGVTTYYGDLMLLRAGVYSWEGYAREWQTFLHRHFHVFGRYYQSLAQSSFDTWLDGYKPGIPDRKVNMYVKGMIVALMLDVSIRKDSLGEKSLDDVMRTLYYEFAKQQKGYSEDDYLGVVNRMAGRDYKDFFEKYVWGLEPLEPALEHTLSYLGLSLQLEPSPLPHERILGIKLKEDAQPKSIVAQIAPGSPADSGGISIGDEICGINGIQVENNLADLLNLYAGEAMPVEVFRNKRLLELHINPGRETYFPVYNVVKRPGATPEQKENYRAWSRQEF